MAAYLIIENDQYRMKNAYCHFDEARNRILTLHERLKSDNFIGLYLNARLSPGPRTVWWMSNEQKWFKTDNLSDGTSNFEIFRFELGFEDEENVVI